MEPAALRQSGCELAAAPEETGAAVTKIFLTFVTRLSLHLKSGARGCRCSARVWARAGTPIAESAVVIVVGDDPALGGLGIRSPRLHPRHRLANGFTGRYGIDSGASRGDRSNRQGCDRRGQSELHCSQHRDISCDEVSVMLTAQETCLRPLPFAEFTDTC